MSSLSRTSMMMLKFPLIRLLNQLLIADLQKPLKDEAISLLLNSTKATVIRGQFKVNLIKILKDISIRLALQTYLDIQSCHKASYQMS